VTSVLDVDHRMCAAIFVAMKSGQIILRPADSGRALGKQIYVAAIVSTAVFQHSTADVHRRALLQIEHHVIAMNVVSHASNRALVGFDN